MNCTQFQQMLADYISGELPPARHADARRHAAECRACADDLAGLQSAAAVLDSGRLNDAAAANCAAALSLPPASPIPASPAAPYFAIPAWARFAAVIALAFTSGYILRGAGKSPAPAEPRAIAAANPAPARVIERYNSITRQRPDAPALSRSLLALAAPARTNP